MLSLVLTNFKVNHLNEGYVILYDNSNIRQRIYQVQV